MARGAYDAVTPWGNEWDKQNNVRRTRLSLAEARRIAMAAQGFDKPRPGATPDVRHFRRVINALGLLQLDYVNVLMPAHFLVLWSRLGPYDRGKFERFVYDSGEFTEQWAHEASIVPVSSWPLLEYRRASWEMYKQDPLRKLKGRSAYLERVLETVRDKGPVTSNDVPAAPGPRRNPGDWHRSMPRRALEYHFGRGDLAVRDRLPNFQRVYDLPERVLPADILATRVATPEAQKQLLEKAASAFGVATMHDLADYYRMSPRVAAPLVDELVEDGRLSAVDVEGWQQPAFLAADARLPRRIEGVSLLSPFDPLVWFRPRAERLFDFHYRIEIYVPAAQRRWGYYVLPLRIGDEIVARVDLKADRKDGRLLALNVHEEPHVDTGTCCEHLAEELHALREWLALDAVRIERNNRFSRQLAAVVK